MSRQTNCREAALRLWGALDDAADPEDVRRWQTHGDTCPECRRERGRDAVLVQSLLAIPGPEAPTLTWTDACRRRERRFRLRPLWAVLAPAAAVAVALLWPHPAGDRDALPVHGAANAADTAALTRAHTFASMGEAAGDPNRAILLLYGLRDGEPR